MVAEIDGYSGLLIGFSMMDLAVIIKSLVVFIRTEKITHFINKFQSNHLSSYFKVTKKWAARIR